MARVKRTWYSSDCSDDLARGSTRDATILSIVFLVCEFDGQTWQSEEMREQCIVLHSTVELYCQLYQRRGVGEVGRR